MNWKHQRLMIPIKIGGIIAFMIALLTVTNCQMETGANLSSSEVYKMHCKRCHGSDGRKGKKGAKDLNLSTMSLENRIAHISEGKDKMPSFEKRLSQEQIAKVAEYTLQTFRKDSLSVKP
ncbi:MAG: cytochrome c [Cytophagales bacterium]|nr:cytochrome c [Cytophagales bacterium]